MIFDKVNIKIVIIIIIAIILASLIGYNITKGNKEIIIDKVNVKSTSIEKVSKSPEVTMNEYINVYIVGCIQKKGVYNIKKGTMLSEIIDLAGGVDENADIEKINMVYKINENVMIKILSKEEILKNSSESGVQISNQIDNGNEKNIESTAKSKNVNEGSITKKININTANSSELDKIPGVGKVTAEKIIEYRKANGNFKDIKDIEKVSGIGTAKYQNIKDYITID